MHLTSRHSRNSGYYRVISVCYCIIVYDTFKTSFLMQKLSQVNSMVQGANDGVRRPKKEARKAVLDDFV